MHYYHRKPDQLRLSKDISPVKYDIQLNINPYELTYSISEVIELQIKNPLVNFICIHAMDFYNIEEITFATNNDKKFLCNYFKANDVDRGLNEFHFLIHKHKKSYEEIVEMLPPKDKSLFQFMYSKDLKPQVEMIEEVIYIDLSDEIKQTLILERSYLHIKVNGNVRVYKNTGFFLALEGKNSKLKSDDDFKEIWKDKFNEFYPCSVFGVQSEPVETRSIFPCFDEPCFKAVFSVDITIEEKYVSKDLKVISNGPLKQQVTHDGDSEGGGNICFSFGNSPPMSTYLLTWVIGHFDYLEDSIQGKVFRVYTPVGKKNSGVIALEIAKGALQYFIDYFGVSYPMEVLYLIPLPESNCRALENWGAITFVNYALLMDENTDIKDRKLNARTICHEISHMWFGNLVTNEWWDDIWLNEGFARYNEFKCVEYVNKIFQIWDDYIGNIYNSVLKLDADFNTHPILMKCKGPRFLFEIFDTISYAKGASVLRMFDNQMGMQSFKEGIIDYLNKYYFQCTTTQELFNVLTPHNKDEDVNALMNSWLKVAGYPVVSARIQDKKFLYLEQSSVQSVLNIAYFDYDTSKTIWYVPLFLKTSQGVTTKYILKEKTMLIDLEQEFGITEDDILSGKDFLKLNHDIIGFYNVIYSDSLFSQILKFKNLTCYDKIGLLFDYQLHKKYQQVFEILNAIKPIEDFIILKYAWDFYYQIRKKIFTVAHVQEYFKAEDILYSEDLGALVDKVNYFFSSLVKNNSKQQAIEEEIKYKIIQTTSSYSGKYSELNDEYLDTYLAFECLIDRNKGLIEFICNNFTFGKMNPNFKYTIYSIILTNGHLFWDENKLSSFFTEAYKDYISSYYNLSCEANKSYRKCLSILENLSKETVYTFFLNYEDYRIYFGYELNDFILENPTCITKLISVFKRLQNEEKGEYTVTMFWAALKNVIPDPRYISYIDKLFLKDKSLNYGEEEKLEKFKNMIVWCAEAIK